MRRLEQSSAASVGKKKTRARPRKDKKRRGSPGGRASGQVRARGWQKAKRTLSLCIIARDEGRLLDDCLANAAGLVDDIVVVDTGSSDDSKVIARRHGARVVTHPWRDDFSAARNESLAQARGDWILVLDCDEVIPAQDHDEIVRLINSDKADAYRLTTRNYLDDRDRVGWTQCRGGEYAQQEKEFAGWFPSTKVRLWRARPDVRFEGVVHELVEGSLQRLGMSVSDCLVPVHHYGYGDGKVRRDEAYVAAGERKVAAAPEDLQARYELAIAYRNVGRLDESLEAITAVAEKLPDVGVEAYPYLEEELVHLVHGDVLGRLGKLDTALAVYDSLILKFPESYQAYNNKGSILGKKRDVAGAVECYRRGLRHAPDNPILIDNLARFEKALGDVPDTAQSGGAAAVGEGAESSFSLSCCIIVRDGGATFERCLASLRDVVDEIVVVDTGSEDDSLQTAERHGARIGHFAWRDDFAAARNASLDLASGDWIMWMDADDYLLPEDRDRLSRAKQMQPDRALYFTLVNEGGRDQSRFRQIKMFPNLPEIRFERPVHETVMPSLLRLGLSVAPTDGEVRHTGYADQDEKDRKQRYYLELMLRWLEQKPDDFDIHFRVGHTYYAERNTAAALARFNLILDAGMESVGQASVYRMAAAFRGRMRLEASELESALSDLETALGIDGADVLANLSIGDVLTKTAEYTRAIPHLQAALRGRPDPHFPFDATLLGYSAHFFLGQCYQATGRYGEAAEEFSAARALCPERSEAQAALSQLKLSAGAQVKDGGKGLYKRPGAFVSKTHAADMPATSPGSTEKLSLCMIVRDEEARLGNCLESVSGLCDEIVVVDTGSRDRTIEVAERFGAKIGHFEWCDDFAAARNASLELATGDWILWLDADDLLPGEYHGSIRSLMSRGRDKAYFFALDDRGYESVSCLQMRLFPNLPGVNFQMPIHEQVTISLADLGIEMIPADVRVVHTGYTTPEVVREKKDRYLEIMERWLESHPEDYMVRSHVALTYHSTGRLQESVDAYLAIVDDSRCFEDSNWVVYTTSLLFLGRTFLKMGELERARDFMHRAEEIDPDYILTRFSLTELYAERGEFQRALEYGESVLTSEKQVTFFPVDDDEVTYSTLCLCGRSSQALGDYSGGESYFRRASEVPVPRRSEALGSLSDLRKSRGDSDGARQALEEASALDPQNAKHIFNLGMLSLDNRDFDAATSSFEHVLELTPNYGPALLNLGFIAKTAGDVEKAERLYRGLIDVDPDGIEGRANLGHLLLALERSGEACEQFELVRGSDETLPDINLGLLQARAQSGNWDEVLAREILLPFGVIDAAVQPSREELIVAVVELGTLLSQDGQPKCGELAFAAVIAAAAGGSEPVFQTAALAARRCLAELFFAAGDPWKAISQYEALLLANPQDGDAFRRLGDCYSQLGVDEAANICYGKSREMTTPQGGASVNTA